MVRSKRIWIAVSVGLIGCASGASRSDSGNLVNDEDALGPADALGGSPVLSDDELSEGFADLTPQQEAALSACEAETGERSFDGCPVQVLCSSLSATDTIVVPVDFARTDNSRCDWGYGKDAHVDANDRSNLDLEQGETRARREQVVDIEPFLNVPGDQRAVFCSVDVAVTPTDNDDQLKYDDDLMLVFGGYDANSGAKGGALLITRNTLFPGALMASVPEFSETAWPLYLWSDQPRPGNDTALVRSNISNVGGGFDLFCLGQGQVESSNNTCAMPETEEDGDFQITLGTDVAQALGIRAALNGNYNLSAIVTGDNNDDIDCQHDGFRADVEVGYILLPEAEVTNLAIDQGLI